MAGITIKMKDNTIKVKMKNTETNDYLTEGQLASLEYKEKQTNKQKFKDITQGEFPERKHCIHR